MEIAAALVQDWTESFIRYANPVALLYQMIAYYCQVYQVSSKTYH